MPIYFREKGYRFFFVSYDCIEPRHVHVVKDGKECKFWATSLSKVSLQENKGFRSTEIKLIEQTIKDNFKTIKQVWDEHCQDTQPKTYKRDQ